MVMFEIKELKHHGESTERAPDELGRRARTHFRHAMDMVGAYTGWRLFFERKQPSDTTRGGGRKGSISTTREGGRGSSIAATQRVAEAAAAPVRVAEAAAPQEQLAETAVTPPERVAGEAASVPPGREW